MTYTGIFHEFYKNEGDENEILSVIAFVYTMHLPDGTVLTAHDDIESYEFFPTDRLPDAIAFPAMEKFVRQLFQKK